MIIKQLSVFVENKPGRIASIADVLSDKNIDISALSIADTTDFGIMRLIVSDTDAAKMALREAGVTVKTTDVLAVKMSDKPGGLSCVLSALSGAGIGIEYMYAFVSNIAGEAVMVMRVDAPEHAQEILAAQGFAGATFRD